MKIHYETGRPYHVDLSHFNTAIPFQRFGIYKYDYVEKLNVNWLKVINYLHENFEFSMSYDAIQYYIIERMNDYGDKLVYDFGFDIPKMLDYVDSHEVPEYKMFPNAFGVEYDNLINYSPVKNPKFYTNAPIIIVEDLVTSRCLNHPADVEMPCSLVVDGNNRVSYALNKGNMGLNCYYLNLDVLAENDMFLSELDKAIYCHTADIVFIQRHAEDKNLKHVARKYYKKSYLMKYFSDYLD